MLLPDRTNIAFIGYIIPDWSHPPIFEMQSRYIARVFKVLILINQIDYLHIILNIQ